MGRRSYSGERRKELARKAKREAKQERKQPQEQGETGGGPPIDWEAQVGGGVPAPETPEGERENRPGWSVPLPGLSSVQLRQTARRLPAFHEGEPS